MRCANCGTQNADDHRFCKGCGKALPPPGSQTSPAEQLLREANLARIRGDTALAIAKAEEALALDPNDAPGHKLLGMLYAPANQTAKAVEHLERALQLQPGMSGVEEELTRLRKRLRREQPAPPREAQPGPGAAAEVPAPPPPAQARPPSPPTRPPEPAPTPAGAARQEAPVDLLAEPGPGESVPPPAEPARPVAAFPGATDWLARWLRPAADAAKLWVAFKSSVVGALGAGVLLALGAFLVVSGRSVQSIAAALILALLAWVFYFAVMCRAAGAISRMTYLEAAHGRRVTPVQALSFATRHLWALTGWWLVVFFGTLAVLLVEYLVLYVLGRIPYLGPVTVGASTIPVFAINLYVLFLGSTTIGALFAAVVAAEECSLGDMLRRCAEVVRRVPTHFAAGALLVAFVANWVFALGFALAAIAFVPTGTLTTQAMQEKALNAVLSGDLSAIDGGTKVGLSLVVLSALVILGVVLSVPFVLQTTGATIEYLWLKEQLAAAAPRGLKDLAGRVQRWAAAAGGIICVLALVAYLGDAGARSRPAETQRTQVGGIPGALGGFGQTESASGLWGRLSGLLHPADRGERAAPVNTREDSSGLLGSQPPQAETTGLAPSAPAPPPAQSGAESSVPASEPAAPTGAPFPGTVPPAPVSPATTPEAPRPYGPLPAVSPRTARPAADQQRIALALDQAAGFMKRGAEAMPNRPLARAYFQQARALCTWVLSVDPGNRQAQNGQRSADVALMGAR